MTEMDDSLTMRPLQRVAERLIGEYVAVENDKVRYTDQPGHEDTEDITFVAHALQTAHSAALDQIQRSNSSDNKTDDDKVPQRGDKSPADMIIASLLHDIGWLVDKSSMDKSMKTSADQAVFLAKHDVIGGKLLRALGFSERVAKLVEGHVQAKRYLTFKEPGYYDKLSKGSKFTLKHQGGIMTAAEAEQFENDDDFALYCLLRTFDEAAKVVGLDVPVLTSYTDKVRGCLYRALWQPRPDFVVKRDLVTKAVKKQLASTGSVLVNGCITKAERECLAFLPDWLQSRFAGDAESPAPCAVYSTTQPGSAKTARRLLQWQQLANAEDPWGIIEAASNGRLFDIAAALQRSARAECSSDQDDISTLSLRGATLIAGGGHGSVAGVNLSCHPSSFANDDVPSVSAQSLHAADEVVSDTLLLVIPILSARARDAQDVHDSIRFVDKSVKPVQLAVQTRQNQKKDSGASSDQHVEAPSMTFDIADSRDALAVQSAAISSVAVVDNPSPLLVLYYS